jgi:hypothetical protein
MSMTTDVPASSSASPGTTAAAGPITALQQAVLAAAAVHQDASLKSV